MSERLEKRLGSAGGITEACQMLWLGKHYSPKVVEMIECWMTMNLPGATQSTISRYGVRLGKATSSAKPAELRALADFIENRSKKGMISSHGQEWQEAFSYARTAHFQIEAGARLNPLTRKELEGVLNQLSPDNYSAEHLGHILKSLRGLGVKIVSTKGRPREKKRRTK